MFSKIHAVFIVALLAIIAVAGSAGSNPSRIPVTSLLGGTQGRVIADDGTKGKWIAVGTANQFFISNGASADPSWHTLVAGDLPNHSAALITSGLLALARGGTNADLSATGGAGQYVKQVSSGAAFTVGTIPAADVPNAAGDVTGPYTALVVAQANGNSFPSGVVLGDIIYGSAANTLLRLAGNTTSAKQFLSQTGTGSVSAAPAWGALAAADIPNAAGDVTGAYTGLTVAKVNGNTFPASAALGDIFYGSAANAISKLTGNTTTTNKYLQQTGTGSVSAAPSWGTIPAADVPGLDASKIISGTLPTTRGGTGSSLTTPAQGTILYANSSNVFTNLAVGTSGQVLQTNGASADPSWATITAAGSGIGAWSSAVTYGNRNLVIGSDSNIYIALAASNLNHDPTTDSGTWWGLFYVTANLTLNVSTTGGARFGSISSGTNPVFSFINYAIIPQGVTLTIQLADGTYSFSAAQSLAHPFGKSINLTGNTTTPANCILSFGSGTNGLALQAAASFGTINGFTIDGVNKTSGMSGVLGTQGAYLTIGANCTIKNWDTGINASNRGRMNVGACTATLSNTGVMAQNQSEVAFGGTASSCTKGIYSSIESRVLCGSATSSSNTTGVTVDGFAMAYAVGITNSSNTANFSQTVNSVTSSGIINN